ncbi:MAG: sulfotransferase domain-containing protein, partial [Porticoccus sp.]|nr:sulfotransferase domain-containing protein [Porticoccus sp.]
MKLMVNSLPKSGTHLLVKLLELSEFKFSGINFSSTNVHGKHKLIKQMLRGCYPLSKAIDVGLDIPSVVRRRWVISGMRKTKTMQYMGGHFPYSDQMQWLLDKHEIKTIYMIRDPRDVILSWAHYVPRTTWHYGKEGLVGKTLEERILLLLHGYQSGQYEIEGFRNILRKSEGWVDADNICVVRFEDIVGVRGGGSDDRQDECIERIMNFCG